MRNSSALVLFCLILYWSPGHSEPVRVDGLFDLTRLADTPLQSDIEIVDGVTAGPDEPIDYSPILRSSILQFAFKGSVNGCIEGILYCEPGIWRLADRNVPTKVVFEQGGMPIDRFDAISTALKDTFGLAGFDAPPEESLNEAELVLVLGSIPYLRSKLVQASDQYGIDRLDWVLSEYGNIDNRTPLFEAACETTYLSTLDRALAGKVTIYLAPSQIDACLPRHLMSVLGLNKTVIGIPSVTHVAGNYRVLTFADQIFLSMLYDVNFPLEQGEPPVDLFWEENFERVYARAVEGL